MMLNEYFIWKLLEEKKAQLERINREGWKWRQIKEKGKKKGSIR